MTSIASRTISDHELDAVFTPVFDRIAAGAVGREVDRRLAYEEIRRFRRLDNDEHEVLGVAG
jgi:hypothetical protein